METERRFTMVRHSDFPESVYPNIHIDADLHTLGVTIRYRDHAIFVHANELIDFANTFRDAALWIEKLGD